MTGERAFVWEVRRPGEQAISLFLLGSIHVLDMPISLGPRLEQALSSAAVLLVEVDVRNVTPEQATALMIRHGALRSDERLDDFLSEATIARLAIYAAQHRFRQSMVDQLFSMRPWAIALALESMRNDRAGLDPSHGVDRAFLEHALPGTSVVGLGTLEEQFASLSAHADPVQESMLREVLESSVEEDVRTLVEIWKRGDAGALSRLLFPPPGGEENVARDEFLEGTYLARNERMTERLLQMLGEGADGRVTFAVVGAGHLVGDGSVPEMLGERGYAVVRMSDATRAGRRVKLP